MARRRARQQERSNNKTRKKKSEKPSAEAISEQERKRRTYMFVGRYEPLLAAKKQAADNLKKLIEEAKAAGVPKREMDAARIARWAGVGIQLDMFKLDKKFDAIFDEGYRAGLENKPGKVPSHHGQNAQQRWLAGYHQGLKELNETRAERFGQEPISPSLEHAPPAAESEARPH